MSNLKNQPCQPCSEVAASVVTLNDPKVCDALRCLLGSAERIGSSYLLDLLTVPQVASIVHKDETWVRRHAKELGVIKFGCGRGADLLFARAAIEGYVRRHAAPELSRLTQ
jgi:hypothetical protein